MPQYHIWTIGCQMNKAESDRIASYLEQLGYNNTTDFKDADLVVLNTCVVRQHAEDKIIGTLGYLKGIKAANPNLNVVVTGCFVNSKLGELEKRFPHVNLFFKPGAYQDLFHWTQEGHTATEIEPNLLLPPQPSPATFVPIIQGCNNFCSYCIVPYRRGREKSHPLEEIVCEVKEIVRRGAKETTLLGQNVNSYGHDLPEHPDLVDLLNELNQIDGLFRIRFLTNHPKDMSQRLIEAMASLDKVCEHINLPLQAGDNDILKAMRRGYTAEQYQHLVDNLRASIPEIALSTDIIVGFPNESDKQFAGTLAMLEKIRFDTVHVAAYSPRPQTIATRKFADNVPVAIKKERLKQVEKLQTTIAGEINSHLAGKTVEVLVEGKQKGKWYGRTRSNKLVFFVNDRNCFGQLVRVRIEKASPWALQGCLAN